MNKMKSTNIESVKKVIIPESRLKNRVNEYYQDSKFYSKPYYKQIVKL